MSASSSLKVVLASGVNGFQSPYSLSQPLTQPLHRFNMPVLFSRIILHHAVSIIFLSRLCLSTLVLKNDILYIYIYIGEERPHFVPINLHGMLIMFFFVRHRENVTETSSLLQHRSVSEVFLKILSFQGLNGAYSCNMCTKHWNSVHESYLYIYSIYTYTVLGFIVPFEYFYCKKKTVVLKLLKINVFLYIKATHLAENSLF